MPAVLDRISDAVARFRSRPQRERPRLPLAVYSAGRVWGTAVFAAGALVAFAWANSPWSPSYFALRDAPVAFSLGGAGLSMSFRSFVNEALMTVFVFSQTLWARRLGAAGMANGGLPPAAGSAGALIVSAIVLSLAAGVDGLKIAVAAAAVDAGLALAAVSAAEGAPSSSRHPLFPFAGFGEASWLVALCLVGVSGFSFWALAATAVLAAGAFAARTVGSGAAWGALFGVSLWLSWRLTGFPPAVAGAFLAMAVPTRSRSDERGVAESAESALDDYDRALDDSEPDRRSAVARRLADIAADAEPPIDRWQRRAQFWLVWTILPLFGWANFGLAPEGIPVLMIAAAFSLMALRPAGAFAGSWILTKFGHGDPVERGAWRPHSLLAALSCCGGPVWALGAVALFPDGPALRALLLAFFGVSALSALIGAAAIRRFELDGAPGTL